MSTQNLTILGCGTLGTAILSGVLSALSDSTLTPPASIPRTFTCAVTRPSSAERLNTLFSSNPSINTVTTESHLSALQNASIILLGCKPYMIAPILATPGFAEACEDKLVISICAGVTLSTLASYLPNSTRIARVMPNTAASLRASMTVISPAENVSAEETELLEFIFGTVGRALVLPEKHMDVATAVCGSAPAFFSMFLESVADGAVMGGVPRKEATLMAAGAMKSAAELVLSGEHPCIVREKISTPGGCTMAGLLRLEEGGVRTAVQQSVIKAADWAGGLGKK